jgi:hypothetical protein
VQYEPQEFQIKFAKNLTTLCIPDDISCVALDTAFVAVILITNTSVHRRREIDPGKETVV